VKRLLHRVQRAACRGQALDSLYIVALRLDREHQARTDRRAIEQDRAAPANSVLATDVRTREAEIVAQVVREQPARIRRGCVRDAVDLHAAKTFAAMTRTR
jgi:hypothetical protein